jgi:hypothetical protein
LTQAASGSRLQRITTGKPRLALHCLTRASSSRLQPAEARRHSSADTELSCTFATSAESLYETPQQSHGLERMGVTVSDNVRVLVCVRRAVSPAIWTIQVLVPEMTCRTSPSGYEACTASHHGPPSRNAPSTRNCANQPSFNCANTLLLEWNKTAPKDHIAQCTFPMTS